MPKFVDHDKQKERIANATLTIIKEVGLEKTTIRKISHEANLSLGTVQYYFPSQIELYIYAMKLVNQRMDERIKSKVYDGMPIMEAIVTIFKHLIPHKNEEQIIEGEAWLSFSLMALRNSSLEPLSHDMYSILNELMIRVLLELKEEKYLENNFDIKQGAMSMHAFIDGITIQALLYPNLFKENHIELMLKNYLTTICQNVPINVK